MRITASCDSYYVADTKGLHAPDIPPEPIRIVIINEMKQSEVFWRDVLSERHSGERLPKDNRTGVVNIGIMMGNGWTVIFEFLGNLQSISSYPVPFVVPFDNIEHVCRLNVVKCMLTGMSHN